MTDKKINTKGGTAVEGDANVGRDFIGRDAINSKTTTISGHTVVALVAVLMIGVIGVMATLRMGLGVQDTILTPALETVTPSVPKELAPMPIDSLEDSASILPLQCLNPPLFSDSDNFDDIMIEILGREFAMGNDDSTFSKPRHRVSVDTFFVDKYEVTNRQYQKFVIATEHQPPESWLGNDYPTGLTFYPVTGVTWHDAVAYCEWAGKRLIREDEWELACKGLDDGLYPWGLEPKSQYANTADLSCGAPTTVGSFLSVMDGQVADLIGNVNEWTHSTFRPYPYNASDGRESSNDNNERRIIRGGSYELNMLMCANRLNASPEMTIADTGFRCAQSKE